MADPAGASRHFWMIGSRNSGGVTFGQRMAVTGVTKRRKPARRRACGQCERVPERERVGCALRHTRPVLSVLEGNPAVGAPFRRPASRSDRSGGAAGGVARRRPALRLKIAAARSGAAGRTGIARAGAGGAAAGVTRRIGGGLCRRGRAGRNRRGRVRSGRGTALISRRRRAGRRGWGGGRCRRRRRGGRGRLFGRRRARGVVVVAGRDRQNRSCGEGETGCDAGEGDAHLRWLLLMMSRLSPGRGAGGPRRAPHGRSDASYGKGGAPREREGLP